MIILYSFAGYVLSREAVRKFVVEGLPNQECRQDNNGAEDVEIGNCPSYLAYFLSTGVTDLTSLLIGCRVLQGNV